VILTCSSRIVISGVDKTPYRLRGAVAPKRTQCCNFLWFLSGWFCSDRRHYSDRPFWIRFRQRRHTFGMCYLQALLKLAPYFPPKIVLWKWLQDVIPCLLLHDILTRSLLWDLGVISLMNMGGRQLPRCRCAPCWLFTPLINTVWNTERVICENCRLKGSFLLNFRCWREMVQVLVITLNRRHTT